MHTSDFEILSPEDKAQIKLDFFTSFSDNMNACFRSILNPNTIIIKSIFFLLLSDTSLSQLGIFGGEAGTVSAQAHRTARDYSSLARTSRLCN